MSSALLADRAVRDVLNAVTVTRDAVRYRATRPLTRRILDSVTGEDRRLSDLFDNHTSRSIDDLLSLTTILNERIAFSDETQAKVIRRLKQVSGAMEAQGTQVRALDAYIHDLEAKFARDIALLTERADARDALEQGFVFLERRIEAGNFTLVDLWRFSDELWWGGFGLLQRREDRPELAVRLRDEMAHRLRRLFARELGLQGPFALHPLLDQIPALDEDAREEVDLLALDPAWRDRPLTRAVSSRAADQVERESERTAVPVVTTTERLAERLLDEAERAGRA